MIKLGLILLMTIFTTIANAETREAIFAGGCFWCLEADFDKLPGIIQTISGYDGGDSKDPTYEQVSSGSTNYAEALKVIYDPNQISYDTILNYFWRHIDPTVKNAQFCDIGKQYRTAIFFLDKEQEEKAHASLEKVKKIFPNVYTEIVPSTHFYPAEEYHQEYYKKNPIRYKFYRTSCGRDARVKEIWQDKSGVDVTMDTDSKYAHFNKTEKLKQLTPLQYKVTQQESTEKPFDNEYWDNKEPGIYVDRISGEPLFSSTDKYDSGTGWPSFTKPIDNKFIITKSDRTLFIKRTEVKSKYGNSHLGHVFNDGPAPTGLRYCMNSAALRFIPVSQLEKEGYGEYRYLFEDKSKK